MGADSFLGDVILGSRKEREEECNREGRRANTRCVTRLVNAMSVLMPP